MSAAEQLCPHVTAPEPESDLADSVFIDASTRFETYHPTPPIAQMGHASNVGIDMITAISREIFEQRLGRPKMMWRAMGARMIVAMLIVLPAALSPALAKSRVMTDYRRAACGADLQAFCGDLPQGHNKDRCLVAHASQLSGKCTTAFKESSCGFNVPAARKKAFPCPH